MKYSLALLLSFPFAAPTSAQTNFPVSVSSTGSLANDDSYYSLISADGNFVVFQSEASNLVTNDFNGRYDIFRRDLVAGTTELVSVNMGGSSANGLGLAPDVSGDGRFVVWASDASNLVSGDTNGTWDCFLRDMQTGTTQRISMTSTGGQALDRSDQPRISPDGQWITFESDADLVPADTNGVKDCYRWNRVTGALDLVSVGAGGALGDGWSYAAQPSDNGRYVVFFSNATTLVSGDTNGIGDVFWKDMNTGAMERVNVSTAGNQATSETIWPSISGDGQVISYCSRSSGLVAGDTNNNWDVFVYDLTTQTNTRINLTPNGNQANSYVRSPTQLSFDGRHVIFASLSTNLVAGDTNDKQDIFLADRQSQTIERVSYAFDGAELDGDCFVPDMTPDLRMITFTATATNATPADTNGLRDIFARSLSDNIGVTFCDPGNSNSTGGPCALSGQATMAGSGLHLEASGGPSGEFGYFLVGTAEASSPIALGQGLLCLESMGGNSIGRYNVVGGVTNSTGQFDGTGVLQNLVGTSTTGSGFDVPATVPIPGSPVILAGQTWHFQVWYRDTPAGSGQSNLSNGLSVTF